MSKIGVNTSQKWTRPASVAYPTVWRCYEGKKPVNGKLPRYRIQDATEDLHEEIIQHMSGDFLQDEPTCSSIRLADDPVSLRELQDEWRSYLKYRIALVALVDPATTANKRRRVAGCNVLGICYKGAEDDSFKYKGTAMKKLAEALKKSNEMAGTHEHFGVNEYMTALGLSVAREHRGQGLGFEILKTRFDLCRAVGLTVTATLFTAENTQGMAAKLGMKTLAEIKYDEYKDEDGKVMFPIKTPKSMKMMAIRIQ